MPAKQCNSTSQYCCGNCYQPECCNDETRRFDQTTCVPFSLRCGNYFSDQRGYVGTVICGSLPLQGPYCCGTCGNRYCCANQSLKFNETSCTTPASLISMTTTFNKPAEASNSSNNLIYFLMLVYLK